MKDYVICDSSVLKEMELIKMSKIIMDMIDNDVDSPVYLLKDFNIKEI